ncbi:MAG: hypothetical protein ACPGQV_11215 [Alphaproteobacteria bacterium]
MLNIFEDHLAVRRHFNAVPQSQSQNTFTPVASFIRWLGERRKRETVDQLNPALLTDVGLKRIGDIVVAAETPDCANDDCADIFIGRRAA